VSSVLRKTADLAFEIQQKNQLTEYVSPQKLFVAFAKFKSIKAAPEGVVFFFKIYKSCLFLPKSLLAFSLKGDPPLKLIVEFVCKLWPGSLGEKRDRNKGILERIIH